MILNFLKLPDCAPCLLLEKAIDDRAKLIGLQVKKIVAKRKAGTEEFLLREEGFEKEGRFVHESSMPPGFPALWLTYPNGAVSKVVVGAIAPGGQDALDYLLTEAL